ncbi:hypothetical protein Drorol1_Dr00008126 [Drosera rotundifolia]
MGILRTGHEANKAKEEEENLTAMREKEEAEEAFSEQATALQLMLFVVLTSIEDHLMEQPLKTPFTINPLDHHITKNHPSTATTPISIRPYINHHHTPKAVGEEGEAAVKGKGPRRRSGGEEEKGSSRPEKGSREAWGRSREKRRELEERKKGIRRKELR